MHAYCIFCYRDCKVTSNWPTPSSLQKVNDTINHKLITSILTVQRLWSWHKVLSARMYYTLFHLSDANTFSEETGLTNWLAVIRSILTAGDKWFHKKGSVAENAYFQISFPPDLPLSEDFQLVCVQWADDIRICSCFFLSKSSSQTMFFRS